MDYRPHPQNPKPPTSVRRVEPTKLDPKLHGIQRSSGPNNPWLMLRDLDRDAPCAAALALSLLPQHSAYAVLRIAVREIEAWLLADHAGFSEAFAVATSRLPSAPDECIDAKRAIVEACARSRKSDVRVDMTPRAGSGREVGPAFGSNLMEFASTNWDPDRAAARSPSLSKAIVRLSEMIDLCRT